MTLLSFQAPLNHQAVSADDFRPLIHDWEPASFGGDGAIEFKPIEQGAKPEDGGQAKVPADGGQAKVPQDGRQAKVPADGGQAKVPQDGRQAKVIDQLIEFAPGDPLTGLRWTGPLPRENYELKLKARRVEGFDFFVAVTFPVGDEHCSFVLGGWGGGVLGISSINGDDAANNETTQYKDFKNGQWYDIRIRVDPETIKCWIDDEEWVSVERGNNGFDIRLEMDPCLPLGLANFQCTSEIKSVGIREIKKPTKAPVQDAPAQDAPAQGTAKETVEATPQEAVK